jgi:hypothetical protein
MLSDVGHVLTKLDWMRAERIWPNGLRYLWTDTAHTGLEDNSGVFIASRH